jgi:ADP-heptose:LPS heptosyltransferase
MAINVMARVTPYATPHATPLAVIQVKPGIGDVIWHLPFVRAIAAAAPGGKVIFFAPPTSAAKELLAAEPCVANTIYFRHAGSELQRGVNLIRLVGLLRRLIGIGASHPDKDWPDAAWCEFLRGLRTPGTVFLIGVPANLARAEKFVAVSGSKPFVNACDLRLIDAAALLRLADLFVGPSSGPLNLAAAGGTDAFGLFGSTPVLTFSKFIHAIAPEGGPSPGGMTRIAPAQVLERIAPFLSRRKASA